MQDKARIEQLYRVHGPAVFRRARRILGHDADAHEVLQDIFLSLVERPKQYAGQSELTTFLYSMTTHACLNRLRNQRTRLKIQENQLKPLASGEASPALSAEQMMVLHHALTTMPEDLSQAAVYYLVDGLTHQEIAEVMRCSRRHVGNLLERVESWGCSQEKSTC